MGGIEGRVEPRCENVELGVCAVAPAICRHTGARRCDVSMRCPAQAPPHQSLPVLSASGCRLSSRWRPGCGFHSRLEAREWWRGGKRGVKAFSLLQPQSCRSQWSLS